MRAVRWAAVAALVLAVGGCSDDDPDAGPGPTPSSPPSSSATTAAPSDTTGTSAPPIADLDWEPVPGPVRDTVTRNADWTLTVRGNGAGWSLDGPTGSAGSAGGGQSGWRVSDALLDNDWAVVVLQERTESRPSRATVTDLATGDTFEVDGSSDVSTTSGGAWALGGGRLLHATVGPGGAYCVATVDLAARESTLGWCAPDRHGFNGAHIAPGGTSLMSFDAGRPSCRTLMEIDGTEATPFDAVDPCVASGRAAHRRWRRLVDDLGRAQDREGALLRDRRRPAVRPRPRHGGQPGLVPRRGVLHPGPADRPRPGRVDAVEPHRRAGRRLRVVGRARLPLPTALRRRPPHDHRRRRSRRRAGHRRALLSEHTHLPRADRQIGSRTRACPSPEATAGHSPVLPDVPIRCASGSAASRERHHR
jgi:hypothetical protein